MKERQKAYDLKGLPKVYLKKNFKCLVYLLTPILMESFIVHKILLELQHNTCCIILLNNWTRWRLVLKLKKHICNTPFSVMPQKCSVDYETSRDFQSEIRGDVYILGEFILESLIT